LTAEREREREREREKLIEQISDRLTNMLFHLKETPLENPKADLHWPMFKTFYGCN